MKTKTRFVGGAGVGLAAVAAMLVGSIPSIGYAQSGGQPSAKATAQCTSISVLNSDTQTKGSDGNPSWTTLLSNTIKTSNAKTLFVDVSLECGLFTRTLVKSKGGTPDTSTAEATIQVRVVIDGQAAHPGVVTFANRMQQLTAVFQGLLTDANGNVCLSVDPDTGAIIIDEDCLRPEELELILRTMSANSFNFITPLLTSGVHTIDIQARIWTSAAYQAGQAEAAATVGKGSFTVEEIRLIKGEDIVLE